MCAKGTGDMEANVNEFRNKIWEKPIDIQLPWYWH